MRGVQQAIIIFLHLACKIFSVNSQYSFFQSDNLSSRWHTYDGDNVDDTDNNDGYDDGYYTDNADTHDNDGGDNPTNDDDDDEDDESASEPLLLTSHKPSHSLWSFAHALIKIVPRVC